MSGLILLAGVSESLDSHIALQLLEKGYRVRATAPVAKVAERRKDYAEFGDEFRERQNAEIVLKNALDGINVVRQAEKGIKCLVDQPRRKNQKMYTGQVESKASQAPKWTYRAATARMSSPSFFTTRSATTNMLSLHSTLHTSSAPLPKPSGCPKAPKYAMSTSLHTYRLLLFLHPSGRFPASAGQVDVRDIAKARVPALTFPRSSSSSPSSSTSQRKRILVASAHPFDLLAILKLLAEKRPKLKDRLTKKEPPAYPPDRMPIDFWRVEEVLGLKKEGFRTVEETVLGAIDSELEVEREWMQQGHRVDIPQDS
ncbi:hypothetical protein FPV67DRAFT_1653782 [Lyophyllum atratum]|nr:hypothetical protein FPV67DRAFT_1653782 [Lyophyllum atratum]